MSDLQSWLSNNLLTLLVLGASFVSNYAVTRSSLSDYDRRILHLETVVVPRSETEVKDRMLDQRLSDQAQQLLEIRRLLSELLEKQQPH